ncbi:hypothetical protein [Synechocystis sp. LKSZ1]|uniref:hypothetical protein n=1 Tax=Synechocystis sp. LKSZ1 TaxID=3144951 RepID=UPI00336BAF9D
MRFFKTFLPLALISGGVFIGFGDRFLPAPLNAYSYQTREQINQTLLGLVEKPKSNKKNVFEKVKEETKFDAFDERTLKKIDPYSPQNKK